MLAASVDRYADGDEAVAVTHSVVLRHDGAHWIAVRVSANRWELRRTETGWRVHTRVNRLLDGDERARALLAPVGAGGPG